MDREDGRATVHEVTKSRTQLAHTQHTTSLYILSEFYYYISGLWEKAFFKKDNPIGYIIFFSLFKLYLFSWGNT